jgi:hypothetical protein
MPQILDILSRMVGATPNLSGKLWEELSPWMQSLALHAAPKWLPRLSMGFPCGVPLYQKGTPRGPCQRGAVATCDACGRPCCLDHARIDQVGDAVCLLCVVELVRQKRGQAQAAKPGPTAEDLEWARKTLGVDATASHDEMKRAHRKLSARHHPDTKRTAKGKANAEAKFKEIQRAYDMLSKHERAQEAA